MNDAVLVEVQGQNGAYYKAYVTDVFEEDEIQLKFDLDWQPESKFPLARVRLPPPAPSLPPVTISAAPEPRPPAPSMQLTTSWPLRPQTSLPSSKS